MNVFVTGGSGFLGQVVVRRLRESGHHVRALARSRQAAEKLSAWGAEPVEGDLDHPERIPLKGVDAVVHCAAPVEFWGPWRKFEKQIVQASVSLARAADRAGVKRFVHISSESVLQERGPLLDINEAHPYPLKANSVYGEAKRQAEVALLALPLQMELLILRPTFIYGPGCPALETILGKAKSGGFMWIDDGQSPFEAVHVENVADAILAALTKGEPRAIYNITDGERRTVREFFTNLFSVAGVPVPARSLPGWLASGLAGFVEAFWRLLRIETPPPLSRFELAFVAQPRRYDISRARAELGYQPRRGR